MIIPSFIDKIEEGKLLFKHRILVVIAGLGLAINLGLWLLLLIQLDQLDSDIALHYNIYFGIDSFGPKYELFFLPAFGLLVLLVNFLLATLVFAKHRLFSHFFIEVSFFIQVLLLISGLTTLFINQ